MNKDKRYCKKCKFLSLDTFSCKLISFSGKKIELKKSEKHPCWCPKALYNFKLAKCCYNCKHSKIGYDWDVECLHPEMKDRIGFMMIDSGTVCKFYE